MSNSLSVIVAQRSWLASNKPLIYVLAPMLLVLAIALGINIYEGMEERRFNVRIRQLQSEGLPVDEASLVALIQKEARSEGSMAWSELFMMQRMAKNDWSPGTLEQNEMVQERDLRREEQTARYIEKLHSLFRMLEKAVEYPAPLMRPTADEGLYREGFYDLSRNLGMEVTQALRLQNTERAMKALDLTRRVNEVQRSGKNIQCDNYQGFLWSEKRIAIYPYSGRGRAWGALYGGRPLYG